MDTAHSGAVHRSATTPRDFFLWTGAVLVLYGAVFSFLALMFATVDRAFPDPLAYSDPEAGAARAAMAGVIILVPAALVLLGIIRRTIRAEAGKAHIWVRRWALVFTIFLAVATILIDLVTLVTVFLGGEITERFVLKAAAVLLVALGIAMHFLADLKGYWIRNPMRARLVAGGVAALAIASLVSGFLVFGSPAQMRAERADAERVSDLDSIQYQVISHYQQTGSVPASLAALEDPLSGFSVPTDPETGAPYEYRSESATTFTLCATFERASRPEAAHRPWDPTTHWEHEEGEICFERTIDPARYPLFEKPVR